jgi:hypothetical protein
MPLEEPGWHLVDDVLTGSSQALEPPKNPMDEVLECRCQVTACIPFQDPPFPFLGIQLWAVLGQPDHMEPRLSCRQGRFTGHTCMARTIVQSQVDLNIQGTVPRLQCLQVEREAGRILPGTEHLNPPPSLGLRAPKDRKPSVGASRGQRRLDAFAVPHTAEVRIGFHMRLVLVVQLTPRRISLHLFFPPPPAPPCWRPPRRGLGGA